jgi:hypothetical protein
MRLVRPYLEDGQLTRLLGAPEYSLPAYVVHPAECDPELFGRALMLMGDLAAAERVQAG